MMVDPQWPPTIDLWSVRDQLLAAGLDRPLADCIGRAGTSQSCLADLREAADSCDALSKLRKSPRGVGKPEREATEMALMATTCLLYARATSTSGQTGERGSIQVSKKLDPAQLEDHEAIVAVRNRAFAHVYPNAQVSGVARHRISVLLVEQEGGGWMPAAATNRVQYDRLLHERLIRQLPIALALVKAKCDKRLEQLSQLLGKSLDDPRVAEIVRSSKIDIVTFFGRPSAAAAALNGVVPGGFATFPG